MDYKTCSEEIIKKFRQHLIEGFSNYKPDPAYEQRCKEYHDAIETEFEKEWARKKFKFLFKKLRQEKLRKQITLRLYHLNPLFYLIECVIDETLPKSCRDNDEWFGKFVG